MWKDIDWNSFAEKSENRTMTSKLNNHYRKITVKEPVSCFAEQDGLLLECLYSRSADSNKETVLVIWYKKLIAEAKNTDKEKSLMKKIELYIVPYAKDNEIRTRLVVDGNKIDSKDNRLTNLVVYQPMRKWLNPYKKKLFVWNGLLAEIIDEFNDKSIHFVFCGCKADFTMFKKSILQQQTRLNRNSDAVNVVFEFTDIWNPRNTLKEMIDILDDLRVEADNWGNDEIIKEIALLKDDICSCAVTVKTDYISSDEFGCLLQNHKVSFSDDSELTIIPVDGKVPVSGICHFLTSLTEKNDMNKKYLVINISSRENEALFDAVISLNVGNSNIKYIENDGDNYILEIVKMYYLAVFPIVKQKIAEILHMFPDHDTNSFLIEISDRIDDLFCISLK